MYVCTNNPAHTTLSISTPTQQILIGNYTYVYISHHHKLQIQCVTPSYVQPSLDMCVCMYVHTRTRAHTYMHTCDAHTHTLLTSYCANDYNSRHTFILNWYFHSHILSHLHKPVKYRKSQPTLVHLPLTYFADAPSTVRCIVAMVTRWQRRWYIIHGGWTGGFECRRGSDANGIQRGLHHGVLNLRTHTCTNIT